MAFHLTAVVSCDTCPAHRTFTGTSMSLVSKCLKLGGWTNDRGLDFCGPCSRRIAGNPDSPLPFPPT